MPSKPLRACKVPGCNQVATQGSRCAAHAALWRGTERPRPTAAERGYDAHWRRIRAQFLKFHPRCSVCGERATDVDHIVALAQGGTHEWANLQAFCHEHHTQKTNQFDGGGWAQVNARREGRAG